MRMKTKHLGPFRLSYGRTRWNEKTVCFGGGKAYDMIRQEWFYFIGLNLYAVFINFGVKKRKKRAVEE